MPVHSLRDLLRDLIDIAMWMPPFTNHLSIDVCILFWDVGFYSIAQACLELDLPAPACWVLGLHACAIMLMNFNGHVMVSACLGDFSIAVIKNTTMRSNLCRVYRDSWSQRDKSSSCQKGMAAGEGRWESKASIARMKQMKVRQVCEPIKPTPVIHFFQQGSTSP